MNITRMKANHLTTPIGCDLTDLTFSWVTESSAGRTQRTARIEIARDPTFTNLVFDSGAKSDIDSLGYQPAITLVPRTRLHWRVTVKNDAGETATGSSWFETGKLDEPWQAKWVTAPFGDGSSPFLVRKTFTLEQFSDVHVTCAVLGAYEIEVNGKPATDEVLLPGYHSYTKQIHAQTFNITPLLRKGENTIGLHIGWGWYRSILGGSMTAPFGKTIGCRCEVHGRIEERDVLIVASEASWQCAPSPVIKSDIYYGEDYDARREIPAWSMPSCRTGEWEPAHEFMPTAHDAGPIHDRLSPPIRIQETLNPTVIKTPSGETVLDFKQNLTGWVEIINRAPADATWRFQVGEILQQGNFYRDNLRAAEAQYTYTSNGKVCSVRPHFTFYGFRYVKLEGFPENVNPADFKAYVIHTELERTGTIKTNNHKVNQIFRNALWGQKGNFLDVPTDCPQRDERLGWTGDAQVFSGTACFNMDCAAFYHKYMNDLMLEQTIYNGGVPHTVPARTGWLRNPTPDAHSRCAWADAATVIPWTVYTFYGDTTLLRRQYPAMKAWVGWLQRQDDENGSQGLWATGTHFADWLALDNYKNPESSFGGTDQYYVATAYYAISVELALKAAKTLGKKSDATHYTALLKKVKAAFLKEYFTPAGRCAVDTQTAYALALHFNLVPETFRSRLIQTLAQKIENNDGALSTGFVGTPILCRALSDNGRSDLAFALLLREKYPSWIYEINLGATTIWERWNSLLEDGTCSGTGMNSMNHYAYGSIVEWMYRNLCGLRPHEDAPGFRKVRIQPDRPRDFTNVHMSFASPVGEYIIDWELKGKTFALTCQIPFNAEAELILPDAPKTVEMNGQLCASENLVLKTGKFTLSYDLLD